MIRYQKLNGRMEFTWTHKGSILGQTLDFTCIKNVYDNEFEEIDPKEAAHRIAQYIATHTGGFENAVRERVAELQQGKQTTNRPSESLRDMSSPSVEGDSQPSYSGCTETSGVQEEAAAGSEG